MNTTETIKVEPSQNSQGFITLILPTHRETIELGNFATIGRDDECDLNFTDTFLSARHCRIEKKSRGYILTDLRSKNGTHVNGVKVLEAQLNDQDLIRIGKTEMLFTFKRDDKDTAILTSSKNPHWNEQLSRLPALAKSQLPVLVGGPSGAGKEIIANLIHKHSKRSLGSLVSVNCSALSESLIESELFGHVRGSFTGASTDRKGAFESARGGTLFLDEIGELPLSLQPKLLRALENNEIKPVGSDSSIFTDVRIVAATHQDLKSLVEQGKFREDLYYRLNVINIKVPPLVGRLEDFDDLVFHICKKHRCKISTPAMIKLKSYPWRGNIRELKNTIARAAAMFPGEEIMPSHLPHIVESPNISEQITAAKSSSLPIIKKMEKEVIIQALTQNKGNQRKTAKQLGMPKSTLHDRIKTFGLDIAEYKHTAEVF